MNLSAWTMRFDVCFWGRSFVFFGRVMSPECIISLRWGYLLGLPFAFILLCYIYIYYKMIKIQTNRQFLSLPLLFLLLPICLSTNISICNTFRMAGVYYTINSDHSNNNTKTNNLIYNYC